MSFRMTAVMATMGSSRGWVSAAAGAFERLFQAVQVDRISL
jgi:hypothetical protein